MFLERDGYLPENDLELALQKDAGIDPAILGWLITQIPVRPLPTMLSRLTEDELEQYRNELSERLKRFALAKSPEA